MARFAVIFFLIFISNLFLFTSGYAFNASNEDPCNQIPGKWKGTWKNNLCSWKAEFDGSLIYKNTMRLKGKIYSGTGHDGCVDQKPIILSGTCNKGEIILENKFYKGYISNEFLHLSNGYEDVFLYMQH